MGGTGWTAGSAALVEQERSAALGARGALFPGCRRRGAEARERRLEPEARPAGSQRSAAGARPRRGRGKKNTLFPLGPPPRIMYQDYPGNFDTSSRGSSGSPAHAESYSSGGGGQQVGAGPGCTWRRGRIPAFLSPPLPLLLSFPFLGLARKFLRATIVSSGFSSCPAHTSFHPLYPTPTLFFFFFKLERRAGWNSQQTLSFTLHLIQTSSWNCRSFSQEPVPPLPGIHLHSPLFPWWTKNKKSLHPRAPPYISGPYSCEKPSPSLPRPPSVLISEKCWGLGNMVGLLQVIRSGCGLALWESGAKVRKEGGGQP